MTDCCILYVHVRRSDRNGSRLLFCSVCVNWKLQMDGQFDAMMSRNDYHKFPDPQPIISLCGELGLAPAEVLVIVRSSAGVRAAKYAAVCVSICL